MVYITYRDGKQIKRPPEQIRRRGRSGQPGRTCLLPADDGDWDSGHLCWNAQPQQRCCRDDDDGLVETVHPSRAENPPTSLLLGPPAEQAQHNPRRRKTGPWPSLFYHKKKLSP